MLLTEDKARNTTCPVIQPPGPCIASQCMAWRWADTIWAKPDGSPEHRSRQDGTYSVRIDRGYCGLGGHPYPAFVINAGGSK